MAARAATLRRIPSLDGIRALAILMVMGMHTLQQYAAGGPVPLAFFVVLNGSLGVAIFFVLSGYLITRLLLLEFDRTGSVRLRRFFLKRALRILPPLYVYLGVLWLIALTGRLALSHLDLFSSLFFLHDYALRSSYSTEHLWSLAVEEQFYLLWPPLLLICMHRRAGRRSPDAAAVAQPSLSQTRQRGLRRAIYLAVAVILLSPVIRVVSFRAPEGFLHHGAGFHMHADLLSFGCLAAVAEGSARFERLYRTATRFPALLVGALALVSALEIRFQNYWNFPLGRTCTGALIVLLLLWCVRNAESLPGRLLNSPLLVHLGVLSYSLYLWQTLFLNQGSQTVVDGLTHGLSRIVHFPMSWLVVFVAAELSLFLVERPSLALRDRLLRRASLLAQPELAPSPGLSLAGK